MSDCDACEQGAKNVPRTHHGLDCPKRKVKRRGAARPPDPLFAEHLRQSALLEEEWKSQVYGPASKAKIQWYMSHHHSDSPVGKALRLLIGSQYKLEEAEAKRVAEKKTAKEKRRQAWLDLQKKLHRIGETE
jgi:hypothetical protein